MGGMGEGWLRAWGGRSVLRVAKMRMTGERVADELGNES